MFLLELFLNVVDFQLIFEFCEFFSFFNRVVSVGDCFMRTPDFNLFYFVCRFLLIESNGESLCSDGQLGKTN